MFTPRYEIDINKFLHMYVIEKKSGIELSDFFHIGRTTVSRYLKALGVPERSISESRIGLRLSLETRAKMSTAHKLQPKGKDSPSWKGGRWIDNWGYYRILINSKYVLEHRYVMSQHIGRELKKIEHIHHINGNKLDNRVDNLKIMTPQEHSALHWSDPQKCKNQSDKIKEVRSKKYWGKKNTN